MHIQNSGGWRMDIWSIPNLVKSRLYKPVYTKVILIPEEGTYSILKKQNSYVIMVPSDFVFETVLMVILPGKTIIHFSTIIKTLRLTH
jgi:hypothetical protein